MPVDDKSGYQTCANCGLETGFEDIIGDFLEADFWGVGGKWAFPNRLTY
jgi:hypothetical protein